MLNNMELAKRKFTNYSDQSYQSNFKIVRLAKQEAKKYEIFTGPTRQDILSILCNTREYFENGYFLKRKPTSSKQSNY